MTTASVRREKRKSGRWNRRRRKRKRGWRRRIKEKRKKRNGEGGRKRT